MGIMGAAYAMSTTMAISGGDTTASGNADAPKGELEASKVAQYDAKHKDSERRTERKTPERDDRTERQPAAQADVAADAARRPAASSKPAPSRPSSTLATALLAEVNKRRAAAGQPALSADKRLDGSAQTKCNDMVTFNYFAHDHPETGKSGIEYARAAIGPYGTWGENLITGYDATAGTIYNGWWASPNHKAAALNSKYKLTGYGICGNAKYPTVVQHFYGE